MTDAEIAELRAGLEGCTGGEWSPGCLAHHEDGCQCKYVFGGDYMGGIAEVYVDNGIRGLANGENDCPPKDEARANLRHIARCSPDKIAALLARLDAAEAENAALNDQLIGERWHADEAARQRDVAVAALKAAEAGWQPIETAPRDGTWIDLYRPPANFGKWACRIAGRWFVPESEPDEAAWMWPDNTYALETEDDIADADLALQIGDCYSDAINFTHWRPLPAPPLPKPER